MARMPYAALQLQTDLETLIKEPVDLESFGEPDGLDVHRTVRLTGASSHAELIESLKDPRITEVHVTEAGYLHVTFSERSVVADVRDPFPLLEAQTVLEEQARVKAETAAQAEAAQAQAEKERKAEERRAKAAEKAAAST